MNCKDCVYYEKENDEWYYCEYHNDLFRDLGDDDSWCTQYKSDDEHEEE